MYPTLAIETSLSSNVHANSASYQSPIRLNYRLWVAQLMTYLAFYNITFIILFINYCSFVFGYYSSFNDSMFTQPLLKGVVPVVGGREVL